MPVVKGGHQGTVPPPQTFVVPPLPKFLQIMKNGIVRCALGCADQRCASHATLRPLSRSAYVQVDSGHCADCLASHITISRCIAVQCPCTAGGRPAAAWTMYCRLQ